MIQTTPISKGTKTKAIYEKNRIFSKNKNGTFGKWIEKMEIHKDNTNVVICKYSLYLEYENKDIEKMSDVEKRKVYLLRE